MATHEKKRKPLQALLIAGEAGKEAVLSGKKNISIREGWRSYVKGPVLIGCHELGWAVGKELIKVKFKTLGKVTKKDLRADGFASVEEAVAGLKGFYPNIAPESKVTVVEWK